MTRPLADAAARERIRSDLDTTFFVEAAAGTGKTTALVGRIVSLLRSGRARLSGVVALTFTDKAAGEMRLRLRGELERVRSETPPDDPARVHLDAALEELELARIHTIHAFCADLLHERPVEAGVDPLFEMASPDDAARLMEGAFDDWFQRALADPPEGVRRLLRRRQRGPNARGARETLLGAVRNLAEHRDYRTPWRRDPFAREAALDGALAQLEELTAVSERASHPDDWLAKNLANLERFVAENRRRERVRGRDHDALEAELRELLRDRRRGWHWKGRKRRDFAPGVSRDEVLARRESTRAELERVLDACDADLAACLQAELAPVLDAYAARKRSAGVLDFVDLLLCARDLLVSSPQVRLDLHEHLSHFFVDEFQDTDPLQAEILLLLAAEDPTECDWRRAVPAPGRLFVVGDPKQSIYRFRRADVALYREIRARLIEKGAEPLELSASFRAVPAIQDCVNAAFEPLMTVTAEGGHADYVHLEPVREDVASQPAVVVLPAPQPYGDFGTVVSWRVEDSYADAVGAFVDWLLGESGWTVEEDGKRVPVAARHVCLLFRRFAKFRDDATRPYARALEARGVPHVLVGGRSFHEREEVMALRNALVAVEWPGDELRVYATLPRAFLALRILELELVSGQLDGRRRGLAERDDPAKLVADQARAPEGEDGLEELGDPERIEGDALNGVQLGEALEQLARRQRLVHVRKQRGHGRRPLDRARGDRAAEPVGLDLVDAVEPRVEQGTERRAPGRLTPGRPREQERQARPVSRAHERKLDRAAPIHPDRLGLPSLGAHFRGQARRRQSLAMPRHAAERIEAASDGRDRRDGNGVRCVANPRAMLRALRSSALTAGLVFGLLVGCGGSSAHHHDPAPPSGHAHDHAEPSSGNPVVDEMRLLADAMKTVEAAIEKGDLSPIPHALHSVHHARHQTEKAVAAGDYRPPKNPDDLDGFKKMDDQFHAELEKLVGIAQDGNVEAARAQVAVLERGCVECHERFQ